MIVLRKFVKLCIPLCLGAQFLAVDVIAQTPPLKKENLQKGKIEFQQNCAECHGNEAMGGAGPNLLESPLVRHDNSGDLIAPVIREGRGGKGMPAFPLMSQADILDIAGFLHARIEANNNVKSSTFMREHTLKQFLTGNAEAGRQYFYGKGRCNTCHSPTGDLAGIASRYSPMRLEARFLYPPHNNIMAIVFLPSGKQIRGKLLHLDAFYVAILNEDGWYRSWSLQQVKVEVKDPLTEHLELLGKYKNKDVHDIFAYLETLK